MYFWQAAIKLLTLKGCVDFYLSPGKLCSVEQVLERVFMKLHKCVSTLKVFEWRSGNGGNSHQHAVAQELLL